MAAVGGTLSLQSSSLFRRMNGAPRHRWDTAHRMSDADAKLSRRHALAHQGPKEGCRDLAPELDEDTWPRRENEEANEE